MRAILFLLGLAPAIFGQSLEIHGSVGDDQNHPVAGATILYNNIRSLRRDGSGHLLPAGPAVTGSVRTAGDGSFVIPGIPEGRYYVCASPLLPRQIGSCSWSAPVTPVPSGGRVNLILSSGVIATFRVLDPQHRLLSGTFSAGVISASGYFAAADIIEQTSAATIFRIVVPPRASVQLFLDTEFTVADSSGQVLPSRGPSLTLSTESDSEIQLVID